MLKPTIPLTTSSLPGISTPADYRTNPGSTSFCPVCLGTGVIEDYQDYGMTTVLAGVYPCDCTGVEAAIEEYEQVYGVLPNGN